MSNKKTTTAIPIINSSLHVIGRLFPYIIEEGNEFILDVILDDNIRCRLLSSYFRLKMDNKQMSEDIDYIRKLRGTAEHRPNKLRISDIKKLSNCISSLISYVKEIESSRSTEINKKEIEELLVDIDTWLEENMIKEKFPQQQSSEIERGLSEDDYVIVTETIRSLKNKYGNNIKNRPITIMAGKRKGTPSRIVGFNGNITYVMVDDLKIEISTNYDISIKLPKYMIK